MIGPSHNLRRAMTPYVGGEAILLWAVSVFMIITAIRFDRGLLVVVALIWFLYVAYIIVFGRPYRIGWDETGITMKASGLADTRIEFRDIDSVRYEIDSIFNPAPGRPFRRLVFTTHRKETHRKNPRQFIDVSLRHFKLEDIDELLEEVGSHRPDLSLPNIPELQSSRLKTRTAQPRGNA